MSIRPCLPGLVNDGKLSQEQADRAGALFDELLPDMRRQFGDQAAEAMASDATLKALAAEAKRKRFLAAQTIRVRQRMEMDMASYNGGMGHNGGPPLDGAGGGGGNPGGIDPRAGPAFLGGDGRADFSNVEGRMRAVRGRAHAMIDGILRKHSANVAGQVRDKAALRDLVREAFGEDSGNLNARELADGWGRSAEMLRQRLNAVGGDIGKLDNWGLPATHDSRRVRAAGYEAWRTATLPRLDVAKMIDTRTGLPFTRESLEPVLREVFETIRSDGWNTRAPGGMGSASLANRRGDARFLIFKSADDWMAYADEFGAGSSFDAMMGHINGMSRDIAMMEILGPNPAHTIEWLKDTLMKKAQLDTAPNSKAVDRATSQIGQIDRMWREVSGANARAENRTLALVVGGIRSYQVATKLGGAFLSAVSDLGFQSSTRAFNGLSQARMIGDYIQLFKPGNSEDMAMLVRRGIIAEEWAQSTAAQSRYLGEELTGEVSRRLAEGVLKLSGLARITQAGRMAFGKEFLATLTENRGKALGELDPALRGALERYGISRADWDEVRTSPTVRDGGADWISPTDLPNAQLGDRILEMIAREVDHAVPVPDLRTKARLNAIAPKGTVFGELLRSTFLFKSFGISVMLMQSSRIMQQSAGNAAKYAAGLMIGTTLMGALALQMKALSSGKDARAMADIPFWDEEKGQLDMYDPGFWGAAQLQGGGFGIFGDLAGSATNERGQGFQGMLAGPVIADAQNIVDIGKSKNKGRALLKVARGQLPGGNIWYGKLALDRLVTDQIQREIDPHYDQSWNRMEKFAREQGTDFWWAPGDTAPIRAPDLLNATRAPDQERPQP